jgi:hypothetical protein
MTDDMTLNAELLNFSGFVRELWARQVAMTQESPELDAAPAAGAVP